MSPAKRYAKKHAKARHRRRLQAQERLARDRRQAQQATEALQQALDDLGLPEDLVAEIEGRLQSQHTLLGKIFGVMFPPLFGCRTNTELCRVRGGGLVGLTAMHQGAGPLGVPLVAIARLGDSEAIRYPRAAGGKSRLALKRTRGPARCRFSVMVLTGRS